MALNQQNNLTEKPKIRFEKRISAENFFRNTELSTPDGYLIEKFNFQPVKKKNTYSGNVHDSAREKGKKRALKSKCEKFVKRPRINFHGKFGLFR